MPCCCQCEETSIGGIEKVNTSADCILSHLQTFFESLCAHKFRVLGRFPCFLSMGLLGNCCSCGFIKIKNVALYVLN